MSWTRTLGTIAGVLMIFLITYLAVQGVIVLIGISIEADSVECDWIKCTFKKTLKETDCYQNGEKVECPEVDIYELHEQDLGNQGQNG